MYKNEIVNFNKQFNLTQEFAKHINYALDRFDKLFKPFLLNLKTNEKINLTNYQKFSSAIFLLETFKSLLLFWETGFGKTIACIYIIKNLFTIYPEWKIFLFVKSSLGTDPWKDNFDKFLSIDIKQHIYIIHYDLLNIEQLFLHKYNMISYTSRILYIFDESHDFIKKIIPKENKPERRLTKLIYPLIKSINKPYNKVLFMSATPINDSFYEFNFMMHLLRNGNLNVLENIFDSNYNLLEPNMLKNTCIGMISYQKRSDIDIFKNIDITKNLAGKRINFINLTMSTEQSNMYRIISKLEFKTKAKGFRTLRKLINTFAFLDLKIKANLSEDKYLKLIKEKFNVFLQYMNNIHFSKNFITKFTNNTLNINIESIMTKNLNLNIKDKIDFISTTLENNENVSNLDELHNLELLHNYSSKYIKTCQLIKQSVGKCLVYQPFVTFEGVRTFIEYLKKFDITYIEYTQKTKKNRSTLIKEFNHIDNLYGQKIKVCIFSSAGTEGISFLAIRDLIIMDIPWSGSTLEQIFGRAIRLNSHINLPFEERYVNIHILINSTEYDNLSVDKEILNIIYNKEKQKKQLINVMQLASLETIHDTYPNVEPVEKENFYPLTHNKYDLKEFGKKYISVIKEFITIYYTFNEDFTNYYEGFLDENTQEVFNNGILVGISSNIYKIVDNKLVYLIKNLS